MNPRQIVLCGLVITPLCTALLLGDFFPALANALLFLLVGLALTYYLALSQKRGDYIGSLDTQSRLLEKIHEQADAENAMQQLCLWSRWLVSADNALLWLEGKGIVAGSAAGSDEEWTALAGRLDYEATVFLVNREQLAVHRDELLNNLVDLLVVTDTMSDGRRLVLFLVNPQQDLPWEQILFRLLHDTRYLLERDLDYQARLGEYELLARTLVKAIEYTSSPFSGHGERVQSLSLMLGRKLHLEKEEIKVLEYAALIHDMGKAMMPMEGSSGLEDKTESEPAVSGDAEQVAIDHASMGASLVPDQMLWHDVGEAIMYHHERYDGSGYPSGLRHNDIPLSARIIAVADVYDALTALAPEEERMDHLTAVAVIKKATGMWFDPLVVVAMEEMDLTNQTGWSEENSTIQEMAKSASNNINSHLSNSEL